MWNTKHKASEFTVNKGCMRLGNFRMESVRIPYISPDTLSQIDYEFSVRKDFQRKGQFYFNPATDFSRFLELAKKVEIKKHWNRLLDNYLHHRDCNYLWSDSSSVIKRILSVIKPPIEDCKFDDDRNEWSLCIPSQDIEIHDGYIITSFVNVHFSPFRKNGGSFEDDWRPQWKEFKEYLEKETGTNIPNIIERDLASSFKSEINQILKRVSRNSPMRFCTYMSKKNTCALFENGYLRIGFSNDFKPLWTIQDAMLQRYEYRSLGISFHEDESWLFQIEHGEIEDSVLSEVVKILRNNNNIVKEYTCWLRPILGRDYESESIFDSLSVDVIKKIPFCTYFSYVPEYYYNRITDSRLSWLIDHSHKVYSFREDASHYSDSEYYDKTSESFRSYLVFINGEQRYDEELDINISTPSRILIVPTNRKYSVYSFSIDTNVCSMEAAAFIIRLYFSSSIYNKRQGFDIPNLFKAFGVYSFHRE